MKNKQVKQMWKSIFTYHEIDGDTVEVAWSKHFQPYWYYEFIILPVVSLTADQLKEVK